VYRIGQGACTKPPKNNPRGRIKWYSRTLPFSLSRSGHRVKRDDPDAAGGTILCEAVLSTLSSHGSHRQRRPEEARNVGGLAFEPGAVFLAKG
jgi:hypothetical protein